MNGCANLGSPRDHLSARVDTDLMSTTGVLSNASIGPIFRRVPWHRHGMQPVRELFFQHHPGSVAVRQNLIHFCAASFFNAVNNSESFKSSCRHTNSFGTSNVTCYTAGARARIKDMDREFASRDQLL